MDTLADDVDGDGSDDDDEDGGNDAKEDEAVDCGGDGMDADVAGEDAANDTDKGDDEFGDNLGCVCFRRGRYGDLEAIRVVLLVVVAGVDEIDNDCDEDSDGDGEEGVTPTIENECVDDGVSWDDFCEYSSPNFCKCSV